MDFIIHNCLPFVLNENWYHLVGMVNVTFTLITCELFTPKALDSINQFFLGLMQLRESVYTMVRPLSLKITTSHCPSR